MNRYMIPALALVLTAAAIPKATEAMSTTVNCSQGQKIGTALAAGFDDIKVRGICTERVEIRDDDIAIEGKSGAKVVGQLFVNGAARVSIKNLIVEGGPPNPDVTSGILARSGASVTVTNVLVQNVAGDGISLDRGASAVLDHVTSQNNTGFGIDATGNSYLQVRNGSVVQNNSSDGIAFELGSGGSVDHSTIKSNGDAGISMTRGASADLDSNTIQDNNVTAGVFIADNGMGYLTNNTITANNTSALFILRAGSARLHGGNTLTTVDGFSTIFTRQGGYLEQRFGHDLVNGRVVIQSASSADFHDVRIDGDLEVRAHSYLGLENASQDPANVSVGAGITAAEGSGVNFGGPAGPQPVHIVGTINCEDNESSTNADPPNNVTTTEPISCTGYSQ